MIYYFKAIKSLVDTKAKNSLTSYPAQPISEATAARPSAALPYVTQKGILILLTEVVEGNNGKDKNSNYDFFLWLQYDRLSDKWYIWKSFVVEDVMISWAANDLTSFFFLRRRCLLPRCSDCFDARSDMKWRCKDVTALHIFFIAIFWMLNDLIGASGFWRVYIFLFQVFMHETVSLLWIRVHCSYRNLKSNVAKLEWTNAAIWPWVAYLLQWDSLNIYLSLLMILQASVPLMVLMEKQGFAAPGWWNCKIKSSELGYIFRTLWA